MHHSKQQSWLRIYPFFCNLIVFIIAAFFTLFVGELGLRLIGKIPGYVPRYSNRAFKFVNQLEVRQSFLTDEEGVFKANPNYEWSTEYQINSDGFRSIEFEEYESTQTKILFLGDSFTWGGTAKPITNCFVDLVARHGYLAFNTGIPGTSPNQYAYLAEKYVPLLKPDIVITMFYMGNDFTLPLPMLPHRNLFHITNAGWLYAFDENGNYMTPQNAYDHLFVKFNAAYRAVYARDTNKTLKSIIRRILTKSVIGTYFWVWLSRVKWQLMDFIDHSLEDSSSSNNESDDFWDRDNDHLGKDLIEVMNCTRRSLQIIKTISEKNGARFILFLIPSHPGLRNKNNSIEDNLHMFEEFNPLVPDFLTSRDYAKLPNDHFNNSGHQKYAEFILRVLEQRTL